LARRSAAVSVICCSLSGEKSAAGPAGSVVMCSHRIVDTHHHRGAVRRGGQRFDHAADQLQTVAAGRPRPTISRRPTEEPAPSSWQPPTGLHIQSMQPRSLPRGRSGSSPPPRPRTPRSRSARRGARGFVRSMSRLTNEHPPLLGPPFYPAAFSGSATSTLVSPPHSPSAAAPLIAGGRTRAQWPSMCSRARVSSRRSSTRHCW
jgi:hypothetical protein